MKGPEQSPPEQRVKHAADSGVFAMIAMMVVCCVGIFVILVLIPLIGWVVGIIVAVLVGAALMHAHERMITHDSRR